MPPRKQHVALLLAKAAQDEYVLDKFLDDPDAPLRRELARLRIWIETRMQGKVAETPAPYRAGRPPAKAKKS